MASDHNIIKGGFTGKLGELYGVQFRGKQVIRAVPFSKAPQNQTQKSNQLAFQCLVRLAAGVSRCNFKNLGLDASKFTKTNSLTQEWRDIIKNKLFEPENLISKYISTNQLIITAFSYNKATQNLILSYDFLQGDIANVNCVVYCIVFDSLGHCVFTACTSPDENYYNLLLALDDSSQYYFMTFISSLVDSCYILSNFQIVRGPVMSYSLDEQPTLRTWLTGEPIYTKSFIVEQPGGQSNNWTTFLERHTLVKDVISVEFSKSFSWGRGFITPQENISFTPDFLNNNWSFQNYANYKVWSEGRNSPLILNCAYTHDLPEMTLYCTIYYTKFV